MPKSIILLFCCCLLIGLNNCKKETWAEPDFVLHYQTEQGIYSARSEYRSGKNEDYQLIPSATGGWYIDSTSDTLPLTYTAILRDKSGQPQAEFSITKLFHRSDLNFLSLQQPYPKKAEDFYNMFKTGVVQIRSWNDTDNRPEGCNFMLLDSGNTYHFQSVLGFTPPIAAHNDTSNYFEIPEVKKEIDFSSLASQGIVTASGFRGAIVTVAFRCKLYNPNSPGSGIKLTSGTFQGFFADR